MLVYLRGCFPLQTQTNSHPLVPTNILLPPLLGPSPSLKQTKSYPPPPTHSAQLTSRIFCLSLPPIYLSLTFSQVAFINHDPPNACFGVDGHGLYPVVYPRHHTIRWHNPSFIFNFQKDNHNPFIILNFYLWLSMSTYGNPVTDYILLFPFSW